MPLCLAIYTLYPATSDSLAPTDTPSNVTRWAGEKLCLYSLPELLTVFFQWENNRQVNGAEYSFHLLCVSVTIFWNTGSFLCALMGLKGARRLEGSLGSRCTSGHLCLPIIVSVFGWQMMGGGGCCCCCWFSGPCRESPQSLALSDLHERFLNVSRVFTQVPAYAF